MTGQIAATLHHEVKVGHGREGDGEKDVESIS